MNRQKKVTSSILAVALTAQPIFLAAAPGTLSQDPLFIENRVQANILFLVDDSGSMDWEILLSEGAFNLFPGQDPNNNSSARYFDFTPDDNDELRELCAGYNVMAYNPDQTYTPWVGFDDDGDLYTNKTLTTALNNPYSSETLQDLTGHFYFEWDDADNDGTYDSGECPADFNNWEITDGNTEFAENDCEATAAEAAGL